MVKKYIERLMKDKWELHGEQSRRARRIIRLIIEKSSQNDR